MIYATGDTHGNFQRFAPEHFPEQAGMTKEDYIIICGDFGGVWDGGKKEERNLDWLEDLPFTTLFMKKSSKKCRAFSTNYSALFCAFLATRKGHPPKSRR